MAKNVLFVAAAVVLFAAGVFTTLLVSRNSDSGAGNDQCVVKTDQPVCGDGVCVNGEAESGCAGDCGVQYKLCGNGACDMGEDIANCSQYCPANYCEIACEEQGQAATADCSSEMVVQSFNTSVAGTCCCVNKSDAPITEACLTEGEGMYSPESTARRCCAGLFPTLVNNSYYTCRKPVCGDGACGVGEDSSNCARDCALAAESAKTIIIKSAGYGYEIGDIVEIKSKNPSRGDLVYYDGRINDDICMAMGSGLSIAKVAGLPGDQVIFEGSRANVGGTVINYTRDYSGERAVIGGVKYAKFVGENVIIPDGEFFMDQWIGQQCFAGETNEYGSVIYNRFTVTQAAIIAVLGDKVGHDPVVEQEFKNIVY